MGFLAWVKSKFIRPKLELKLGLALGSGGAKGMAHLGALRAFEEAGLSFSVVTGTSIGSIVGALYAKGYTSSDMISIVEALNRKEFARNLRPFSDMAFVENYLQSFMEGNIEELPMPYAAWATDGETNAGVLLDHGPVTRAVTASSAIPPFFRSVEIEGKKLYDGAYTNAIPADVCRDLGAQFVVGIDLSAYLPNEEDKGLVSRLVGSALGAFVPVKDAEDRKTRGYEAADVMLRPNLADYRSTDVSREGMEAMFEIGYREASARIGEITAAIAERRRGG